MAEVAADCGMSPGNLYRLFPGKLDIAEAIASAEYQLHLEDMRKLLVAPRDAVRWALYYPPVIDLQSLQNQTADPQTKPAAR